MSDSTSIANKNQFDEDLDSLAKILLVDARLIAVKNIQCSAGSSSGDNYMSVVKRVVVKGVDSENKETELSLIIKRQIPSLSRRQLYRCDEAFNNEINAYKYVIPMLEAYTRFKSCPKCQFAGKDEHGELIVLEDLKCLGYQMESRLLGLDFDHCKLVMEELATLHAASITVKHVDDKVFYKNCQYIKEIVYCPEADDFYKAVIETSIQESLSSLKLSNKDGSLSEPIRLISELETKLHRVIREYITKPEETYSVICHGDLWVNNIMFKKNSFGQVSSVKFLDLQAMRYASPVFDILHFIYTSTKRDVRDAYLRDILEIYSGSLISKLKVHLYPKHLTIYRNLKALYSLQNIMEEFYSNVLYGLAACMWVLPAVTFDPNNIPDLDTISDLQMSAKELNMTQNLTPEYHSRMKDIALEFYQNGFLNKN